MSRNTPAEPSAGPSGDRLPQPPRELRLELLRRLELMEREVRALDDAAGDPLLLTSIETLREMERELRTHLVLDGDVADWPANRSRIIEMWKQHRRTFERLAGEFRRKHPARSGRRETGPRW